MYLRRLSFASCLHQNQDIPVNAFDRDSLRFRTPSGYMPQAGTHQLGNT